MVRKNKIAEFAGVDNGTSKCAVVDSNGNKVWRPNVIKPRDTLTGRKVLYGQDAIDARISGGTVYPMEHGFVKPDVAHQKYELDFLVDLFNSIPAKKMVVTAPAEATERNKTLLIEASRQAEKTEFEAVIFSQPYAAAFSAGYGFGRDLKKQNASSIDVGEGTADVCLVMERPPINEAGRREQETIQVGGRDIKNMIISNIKAKTPYASVDEMVAEQILIDCGFVGDLEDKKVEKKVRNYPLNVQGRTVGYDLYDVVRDACGLIIPPIIDCMRDLIGQSWIDGEFKKKYASNLVLSGRLSQLRGLDKAVAEESAKQFEVPVEEINVTRLKDPLFAGAEGAVKLAKVLPDKIYWEPRKIVR